MSEAGETPVDARSVQLSDASPMQRARSPGQRRENQSIFESLFHRKQQDEIDEEEPGTEKLTTSIKKKNKKGKKTFEREEIDFTLPDLDGRNILHRAALEQNIKLVNDVLEEYRTVLEQMDFSEEMIDSRLNAYINGLDKFKMSSILLCCFVNIEEDETKDTTQINQRFECISSLAAKGADINVKNPRTLWSPIFWCSFYGDAVSVKYLLEHHGIAFEPDYKGYYPFDYAGRNNHKEVVELLIRNLAEILFDYQLFQAHQLRCGNNVDKHIFYQDLANFHDRMLQNPLLKVKMLFWVCYFSLDLNLLKQMLSFPRVYYNAPIYNLGRMTALHAAAQVNVGTDFDTEAQMHKARTVIQKKSEEAIQYMLDRQMNGIDSKMLLVEYRHIRQTKPSISNNHVFQFTKEDLKIYKDTYCKEVIIFAKWEREHLSSMRRLLGSGETENDQVELLEKPYEQIERNQVKLELNSPDLFGNTALHLASLKGNTEIVKLLISFHADMEIQNKEFFKPRELTQHEAVIQVYKQQLASINEFEQLKDVEKVTMEQIKLILVAEQKQQKRDNQMIGLKRKYNKNNTISADQVTKQLNTEDLDKDEPYQQALKRLFIYSNMLFVPDFVIKCQLKEFVKDEQSRSTLFRLKNDDSAEMQSLNFQVSLLQNAGFEIFLMKSYNESGYHYIMLSHTEDNLETQAQFMQLQVKLIDSYDLEPFQKIIQDQFEPFRSRQRQEIIESHVKRIMNLEQLIKAKSFSCYYRMHTYGGIERVKNQWILKPKWYWPQPFSQFDDYLFEGQTQNFTSLTTMRLYLGEKISFFFAWKSFVTCALLALAVPGLALQIYIILTNNYQSEILPYWVFYVCIWSTLQVEFWKRKTSEINTRWGCIDLMEDEEAEMKVLREGFSGDEEVSDTTGELTKHQEKSQTILLLMVSIPILTIFVLLSIAIFLGVEQLQITYASKNTVLRIILGILQGFVLFYQLGLGITILNLIYTLVAQWFAQLENHKFKGAYESSLIYKNVLFKLINSYLSIFYFMFNKDKTLEDIFFLMLPVLVVKQVNYMILEVFLPQMWYQHKENRYFNRIQKTITQQHMTKRLERRRKDDKNHWLDAIQEYWHARLNRNHRSSARAVLQIHQDDVISEKISKNKRQNLESNLDVDAVELNSLKLDFEGTMNYFMEGIIDYGYITLFAAAFPMGPIIALIVSVPEIRMKVYSFLYVYKRPTCERCSGIGEWLNVIEMMSVFGVFSNFALLYFKHKKSTVQLYQSDNLVQEHKDLQVWFFILSIAILMILKEFFKDIIPDKPEWVCQEIEKMKKKQEQESGKKSAEKLKHLENQIDDGKRNYQLMRRKISRRKEQDDEQMRFKNIKIEQLQSEITQIRKLTARMNENSAMQLMKNVGKSRAEANEYDMIVFGGMRYRFYQIEWQILISRLNQIDKSSTNLICVCQECGKRSADIHCINCDENLCLACYKADHLLMNLKHEVNLIQDITTYTEADLAGMIVVQRKSQIPKKKFKFSKEEKQGISAHIGLKRWKKIECFSIPTYNKSEYFQYLQEIYQMFHNIYMELPGIAYRNFEVDPFQLFGAKMLKPQDMSPMNSGIQSPQLLQFDAIEEHQNGGNQILGGVSMSSSVVVPEPNPGWDALQSIINMKHFNTEDKLFLNRLAFLTFKRYRHLTHFNKFYSYCKILQDGMLEQKLILLVDLIDISDDGEISKEELARLFIPSIIQGQDMSMTKQVDDMINMLYPQDTQKLLKKDLTKLLINQCQDSWLKPFLEALMQEQN